MPRREPRPYFKKSHKAWYVKINGVHHPLGKEEEAAWEEYHRLMIGRRDLGRDPLVYQILNEFLGWCQENRAPGTFRLHQIYCVSFARTIPASLKVRDLKPRHLVGWVDANWPAATSSPSTRHGAMRAVQRALNWARKMGHTDLRMLSQVYEHVSQRQDHLRKGLDQATGHLKSSDKDQGGGDGSDWRVVG